jgi:hypothetical protein
MRKVEATIEINCSTEEIFNAFIQPQLLKQWWNVDRCLVEPQQGGVYSLAWNVSKEGFQYVSTGIITVFNPAKELMIDHFVYFNPEKSILGPTFLSVKLENNVSSTKLNLVQGSYQYGGEWDWFYDAVKDAWPKVLFDLKSFLEKEIV